MKPMVDTAEVEAWAKTQKRITNRMIRMRFDLNEDAADTVYSYLRTGGIIGSMGYVKANEK